MINYFRAWPFFMAPLLFWGCSQKSLDSPVELFRLRSECSNLAHRFEADWRRENGSAWESLSFRNHYNQIRGRCYVEISYGTRELFLDWVQDATEGIDSPRLASRTSGSLPWVEDKAALKKLSDAEEVKIRDLMEN
jgi:hypothetical protein